MKMAKDIWVCRHCGNTHEESTTLGMNDKCPHCGLYQLESHENQREQFIRGIVNNSDHEVKELENGWHRLISTDAWMCYLKTYIIEGKYVTVYLDDFSVAPISLKNYSLKDLVVDEDWSMIHEETFFEHDAPEVVVLKDQLPSNIFNDVKEFCDKEEIFTD
jgi:predicted  nucleic acid-binding Zn-ribbon protein